MLLLWIIYVISVLFLLCLRHVCLLVPCGHLLGNASWLSFVMSNCEVVTIQLVSWVRCGAWLYRFLTIALFLTLSIRPYACLSAVSLTWFFFIGFLSNFKNVYGLLPSNSCSTLNIFFFRQTDTKMAGKMATTYQHRLSWSLLLSHF